MTKKDISELTRRFKKEECTFTRLSGCYVDGHKNIVLNINETFLNIVDEELYKYLEIAKKAMSGTVGNNLLELEFTSEEIGQGGKQQFLLGLRDSKLKNEDLLMRLYELVIDNYEYVGNYLILVFHDAYDVMTKTKDNAKLDESEEVYEYLICAICPVELTKAGLGYREEENRIGARIRDWAVTVPETGFVFPAFTDRSSDVNSVIYYTKNAKNPNADFMEGVLGCKAKRTAVEEKQTFLSILKNTLDPDDDGADDVLMEIQQNLNQMVEEHNTIYEKPVFLTNDTIETVLKDSGVAEDTALKIQEFCSEEFGENPPDAKNVVDIKALTAHAQKVKEQELKKQVHVLKQQLEETKTQDLQTPPQENEPLSAVTENEVKFNYDIVLNVKPQKVSQIKTQMVDGKKCIVIPMDEFEQATINGENAELDKISD